MMTSNKINNDLNLIQNFEKNINTKCGEFIEKDLKNVSTNATNSAMRIEKQLNFKLDTIICLDEINDKYDNYDYINYHFIQEILSFNNKIDFLNKIIKKNTSNDSR